ncbi:MAG: hypothetical protein OHK93_004043 [Ramalina farinacea]|uniref:Uncharacterized protein n=1 Tax=Ramalina farinacea TaxID=258253 RepID=A0AA43QIB4_9LECA|nr:hypothetical protein [Ramalina farinacea]
MASHLSNARLRTHHGKLHVISQVEGLDFQNDKLEYIKTTVNLAIYHYRQSTIPVPYEHRYIAEPVLENRGFQKKPANEQAYKQARGSAETGGQISTAEQLARQIQLTLEGFHGTKPQLQFAVAELKERRTLLQRDLPSGRHKRSLRTGLRMMHKVLWEIKSLVCKDARRNAGAYASSLAMKKSSADMDFVYKFCAVDHYPASNVGRLFGRQPSPRLLEDRCACQVPAGAILNKRRQRREDPSTLSLLTRLQVAVARDIKAWHGKDRFAAMDDRYEDLTARLWSELSLKSRKKEMSAVVWEDSYTADVCGDTTYSIPSDAREVWTGRVCNPFLASPDAIYQIASDPIDKQFGYHLPGNVAITSLAFNRFCGRFPKAILRLANISREAQSETELQYVANAVQNIFTTMHRFPILKRMRSLQEIPHVELEELHSALRTTQPFLGPRDFSDWRLQGSKLGQASTHTASPSSTYRYEQLFSIANLPQYRAIPYILQNILASQ